jgi:hypothetical protein
MRNHERMAEVFNRRDLLEEAVALDALLEELERDVRLAAAGQGETSIHLLQARLDTAKAESAKFFARCRGRYDTEVNYEE